MNKTASIVLPTYSESENIKVVIPLIFKEAENIPTHELHIVVGDDNSPDGTAELVWQLMEIFPNLHLSSGEKRLGRSLQEKDRVRLRHAIGSP